MKSEIHKKKIDENEFLNKLKDIYKPPKEIYTIGKLPKSSPAIAVVGTRKPTPYGKEVAYKIAYDLAKKGVIIVSGLAIGIDSIAHKAALEAGGTTIAVLGNGLHKIYPSTNKSLAENIIQSNGAIISEYTTGVEAKPYHFLQRNRIVSGLCDGVVIVEAAEKSGTLNTASHALDQGKEIYAVPGNITSKMSVGCNKLLKQGAIPLTCAEDIIENIYPDLSSSNNQLKLVYDLNPIEENILNLIENGTQTNDELIKQSDLSASDVLIALTNLEIDGVIKSIGPNTWQAL